MTETLLGKLHLTPRDVALIQFRWRSKYWLEGAGLRLLRSLPEGTEFDQCETCRVVVFDTETSSGSYACVSCGHIVCGDCLWSGAPRTRPTCKACVPADALPN